MITALKKDGYLAELHKKWFGAEPDAGTTTVAGAGHARSAER